MSDPESISEDAEPLSNTDGERTQSQDNTGSAYSSTSDSSTLKADPFGVTPEDYEKYKERLPTHLTIGHYDGVVLCHPNKDDLRGARQFLERVHSEVLLFKKEIPKVVLYSDILPQSGMSPAEHLDLILPNCTFVFLYITKSFCTDKWSRFSSLACLMDAINIPHKKWSVVPIYTEDKYRADYRIPFTIRSIKGVEYYNDSDFCADDVRMLLETRLHTRKESEKRVEHEKTHWIQTEKGRDKSLQYESEVNAASNLSRCSREEDELMKRLWAADKPKSKQGTNSDNIEVGNTQPKVHASSEDLAREQRPDPADRIPEDTPPTTQSSPAEVFIQHPEVSAVNCKDRKPSFHAQDNKVQSDTKGVSETQISPQADVPDKKTTREAHRTHSGASTGISKSEQPPAKNYPDGAWASNNVYGQTDVNFNAGKAKHGSTKTDLVQGSSHSENVKNAPDLPDLSPTAGSDKIQRAPLSTEETSSSERKQPTEGVTESMPGPSALCTSQSRADNANGNSSIQRGSTTGVPGSTTEGSHLQQMQQTSSTDNNDLTTDAAFNFKDDSDSCETSQARSVVSPRVASSLKTKTFDETKPAVSAFSYGSAPPVGAKHAASPEASSADNDESLPKQLLCSETEIGPSLCSYESVQYPGANLAASPEDFPTEKNGHMRHPDRPRSPPPPYNQLQPPQHVPRPPPNVVVHNHYHSTHVVNVSRARTIVVGKSTRVTNIHALENAEENEISSDEATREGIADQAHGSITQDAVLSCYEPQSDVTLTKFGETCSDNEDTESKTLSDIETGPGKRPV